MKFLSLISLIFCSGICRAQSNNLLAANNDDNSILWEVSGNGLTAHSYLYGTFHMVCRDDIKISSACKQAIKNSGKVYLELDMDDPAMVFSGLMLMNMKGGKKLKDLYSPESYKRISDYFTDSLKTPMGLFQNLKPMFLLAMLYPKMMPCTEVTSVEEDIMRLAKENGKEINGLETIAFQASVFDSIPYEKQAEELLNAIDSMEKSRKYYSLMAAAYANQKMDAIEKLMNDPDAGIEDNQDILIDNRNKNWVGQLKAIMKNGPVFVAVGTAHLIGENGLVSLLRKEGYSLRPLFNK